MASKAREDEALLGPEDGEQTNRKLERAKSWLLIARLYVDRGDFLMSLPYFDQASSEFRNLRQWDSYLESQTDRLRVLSEQGKIEVALQLKEELIDLALKNQFTLGGRFYFTLGVCESHRMNFESAKEYFSKSIETSLGSHQPEIEIEARIGLAIVHKNLKQREASVDEILRARSLFDKVSDSEKKAEWECSLLMLEAQWHGLDQCWKESLEKLELAFEMGPQKRFFALKQHLLFNIGRAFVRLGQVEKGKWHLELVRKFTETPRMDRLRKATQEELEKLEQVTPELGFILDEKTRRFHNPGSGWIEFDNLGQLWCLLKLLYERKTEEISKEEIAQVIWGEVYKSEEHDNRIYAMIRRLRQAVEPDPTSPVFLIRGRKGYCLSLPVRPSVKIFNNPTLDHPGEKK